jgi:hypothetical protein
LPPDFVDWARTFQGLRIRTGRDRRAGENSLAPARSGASFLHGTLPGAGDRVILSSHFEGQRPLHPAGCAGDGCGVEPEDRPGERGVVGRPRGGSRSRSLSRWTLLLRALQARAVPCFVTHAGFRRRGATYALARAAVSFAHERGARALEGYPMVPEPGKDVPWGELHVGHAAIFAAAGFAEVSRPTLRRAVMRIDF